MGLGTGGQGRQEAEGSKRWAEGRKQEAVGGLCPTCDVLSAPADTTDH